MHCVAITYCYLLNKCLDIVIMNVYLSRVKFFSCHRVIPSFLSSFLTYILYMNMILLSCHLPCHKLLNTTYLLRPKRIYFFIIIIVQFRIILYYIKSFVSFRESRWTTEIFKPKATVLDWTAFNVCLAELYLCDLYACMCNVN